MNNDALFYIPKAIVPKITVTSGCAVSCNVWVITDFIRTCHQCTCFQLAYCHLGSLIFLFEFSCDYFLYIKPCYLIAIFWFSIK